MRVELKYLLLDSFSMPSTIVWPLDERNSFPLVCAFMGVPNLIPIAAFIYLLEFSGDDEYLISIGASI